MTISPMASNAPEAFGSNISSGIERDNLEHARQYLAAIESGFADAGLSDFLAPDIRHIEYPNQLVPKGAERDLAAMTAAAERGRRVVRSQRYEVRNAVATGQEVALEVLWVGTLAVAVGALAAGAEMRANFAVFLTFRDGLITRQRNYDCFDPF